MEEHNATQSKPVNKAVAYTILAFAVLISALVISFALKKKNNAGTTEGTPQRGCIAEELQKTIDARNKQKAESVTRDFTCSGVAFSIEISPERILIQPK